MAGEARLDVGEQLADRDARRGGEEARKVADRSIAGAPLAVDPVLLHGLSLLDQDQVRRIVLVLDDLHAEAAVEGPGIDEGAPEQLLRLIDGVWLEVHVENRGGG